MTQGPIDYTGTPCGDLPMDQFGLPFRAELTCDDGWGTVTTPPHDVAPVGDLPMTGGHGSVVVLALLLLAVAAAAWSLWGRRPPDDDRRSWQESKHTEVPSRPEDE